MKKFKFKVADLEGIWFKFRKRISKIVEGQKLLDIIRVYVSGENVVIEIENYELTPKKEFIKKQFGKAFFSFSIEEVNEVIKALKEAKEMAKRNEMNLEKISCPEGVWYKFKEITSSKGRKFLDIIEIYVNWETTIIHIENHRLTPKREYMNELGRASFGLSIEEVNKVIKALKEAKKIGKKESLK
jgi:predicted CopG family antitoxin